MKYSRPNKDCFVLLFEVEFGSSEVCEVKFLNGKEKLQFQEVFFETFILLKPEVLWKMSIFLCSY